MTAIKYTPPLSDLLAELKTVVHPGTPDAVLHVPSKAMPRLASALNAHDDLVAALSDLLEFAPTSQLEDQACAALAKAKGE